MHFNFSNCNKTFSEAMRPIFPKRNSAIADKPRDA